MQYQKKLIIAAILLWNFGCSKKKESIDVPSLEFSVESQVLDPELGGLVRNDEIILIDLNVLTNRGDFEYLNVSWEYQNGDEVLFDAPSSISHTSFTQNGDYINYQYSIQEEALYHLFLDDIKLIEDGTQFKFSWDAYNSSDELIDSNTDKPIVISVNCEINQDYLTGLYILDSNIPTPFFDAGNLFREDTIVVAVGSEVNERMLYVNFNNYQASFMLELNCGGIEVPSNPIKSTESGASNPCGNEPIILKSESLSSIDYSDDSDVRFEFTLDYNNACGFIGHEEFRLIKVD